MKSTYFAPIGIFVLCCGFLLVSCKAFSLPSPTPTSIPTMPPATSAPIIQPTQQFVIALTPTFTPTFSPPLVENPTPLSTQLPIEAEKTILDLYQNNGNCLLPCFWGFTPGLTEWHTAKQFMTTFAYEIYPNNPEGESFIREVYFSLPQVSSVPIDHMYGIERGIITTIEAYLLMVPDNIPQSVLSTYGPPTEVWLLTANTPMDDFLGFYVTLFYGEDHFLLTYSGQGTVIDEKVRGCLSEQAPSLRLVAWSPEQELTFAEAIDGLHEPRPILYNLPLEEATDMNVDTFYEMFKNANEPICLETDAQLWPGP